MASITLNPSDSDDPDRYAVEDSWVRLTITGGKDLTGLTDKAKDVEYDNIKQKYTFNFYTNSKKTTKVIEKTGAPNNNGKINVILYGLKVGEENEVEVSISYSYDVRNWKTSSDPVTGEDTSDWGNWETKTNSSLNEDELYVYTRNNKVKKDFWTNSSGSIPATNSYIDEHITVANTVEWLEQLGIWTSWKEQSDFYSSYNATTKITTVTVPNRKTASTTDRVTISTPTVKNDITAAWYNTCSSACNGTYSVNKYDQYISAAHFTDLATKVTTWT